MKAAPPIRLTDVQAVYSVAEDRRWELLMGNIVCETVRQSTGWPAIEIEIRPVCDARLPAPGSRLQALVEPTDARRTK